MIFTAAHAIETNPDAIAKSTTKQTLVNFHIFLHHQDQHRSQPLTVDNPLHTPNLRQAIRLSSRKQPALSIRAKKWFVAPSRPAADISHESRD